MIDSGTIYNFIDLDFVRIYTIKTYPISHPMKLLMIDG
jgi:hypothetical protein